MSTAATPPERGTAIVLAAGAGTRMKSKLSKVLQPLLGQPMAAFPVGSAQAAGLDVLVVVNHQEDQVRAGLAGDGVRFVRQEALNGTGGAVIDALAGLPATGVAVVLYGDCPLIRAETLTRLLDAHAAGPLATVVTAHASDPAGYGRLVRDAAGRPQAVVEHKECTTAQLAITEVNVGLYAFDIAWMRETLPTLEPHSHKNEVYLTDLVAAAAQAEALEVVVHDDIDEMMGVNDKWSLCEARRLLQDRVMEAHARAGVTFESPTSTVVEFGVRSAQTPVWRRGRSSGAARGWARGPPSAPTASSSTPRSPATFTSVSTASSSRPAWPRAASSAPTRGSARAPTSSKARGSGTSSRSRSLWWSLEQR